ncbi:DUF4296 domain-containing protein [Prevotella dentasini]|uniref:DUF4296 domain-containing protein n=1 Tax=Prevotella dentasini TaxID=589537 RepID=UPI00056D8843|nr:DUF4296 domain-containing protein [Prevotella dentasini]
MQRDRICVFLLFAMLVTIVVGCKPTVSSDYIQPGDMEDILYDYHVAVAMGSQQAADDVVRKAYRLSVLKKHGVSQQEFDASLQYYMQHTEYLHDIYEHLAERLESEARAQGASESELSQLGGMTAKGDTADVWNGARALVMSPFAPNNCESFTIQADTAYHSGDRLMLGFDSQFITQQGIRDAIVVMSVKFTNDSIATISQHFSSDSHQTMMFMNTDSMTIKSIRGYFMLLGNQGTSASFRLLTVSNIHLVRMHVRSVDNEENGKDLPTSPIRTIGGSPASPAPQMPPPTSGEQLRTPVQAMKERNIPLKSLQ